MKIPPRLVGLAFLVSLNCAVISVAPAQSPSPTQSPTATPTATASPTPTVTPTPAPPLPPPVPPDGSPTAAIGFPDSTFVTAISNSGLFPHLTTQPGQSLNIQLLFPPSLANTTLIVQVLDGGSLLGGPDEVTIGSDGTASIQFQTGAYPGLYRVLLSGSGTFTTLQFWATNP